MQRTRNVDVGERIGRRRDVGETKLRAAAPSSLDELNEQISARKEGDTAWEQAHERVEQAKIYRDSDRVPFLPGQVKDMREREGASEQERETERKREIERERERASKRERQRERER